MSQDILRPSKRCSKCRKEKQLSDFGVESRRPDGLRCFCRDCGATMEKQYTPLRAIYHATDKYKQVLRRRRLRNRFGITPERYLELVCEQGGLCAICGKKPKKLQIDHSHITGKVRGLLCCGCNTGLGKLGDSREGLLRALAYLDQQGHAGEGR